MNSTYLGLMFSQVRAVLAFRAGALRTALRDGERGASAVELAIITAIILGIAVALLAVINTFVTDQSNVIKQNDPGAG
jgi:Flp pilus assembly pilin Flp